MLIFLDTEFTDFEDCDLISIGMVSEDGHHEFYAERTDYRKDACNTFVRREIEPLLGQKPEAACSSAELKSRLWNWFASLPSLVQLACDSERDKDLLWRALGDGLPLNLKHEIFDLRPMLDTQAFYSAVAEYYQEDGCALHHALHDARASRMGWQAYSINKLSYPPDFPGIL